MAYTNRKAPEDTEILRTNLDQGLDVRGPGRYYPEEYSGQIQAIQQKGSVLGEIPKSLAGIIESYDDYKISSWYDDEQVSIAKEKDIASDEIRNRETEMQLRAGVEIYDRKKEMQSELIQAYEQADRDRTDRTLAAQTVLEKYENPEEFEGRLALQQMWKPDFQRDAITTLAGAQKADLETLHARRAAALQDMIFTGYGEVLAGRENPEQSLNRMMPSLLELTKDLPADKVQEYMTAAWNQLVLANAERIVEQIQRGNVTTEAGMNALRALASDYTQKEFRCVDKGGNVLKNQDGSDKTFTLTLTSDTQNHLYRVFKETKSGGNGTGEEILVDYMDGFKERIGWDQFEKTGTSDKLLGTSPEDLKAFMKEQLNLVNNSTASASKKASTMTDMLKMYSQVETFMNVANSIKGGDKDIKKFLNDAVTQLENDLTNFNGDWANYTLKVNGKEIGIAGIHNEIPQLGSIQNASAIYWSEAAGQFRKLADLVNNGSAGELFVKIDQTCNNAANYLEGFTAAGTLTKGDGYSTSINQDGVKKVRAAISQFEGAIQKQGYGYTAIPNSVLDRISTCLNSKERFEDPIKRYMGTRAIVQAFQDTGHLSDLMRYAANHSGEGQIGSDFVLAMCLNQENLDATIASGITELVMGMNEARKKTLNQALQSSKLNQRAGLETEVFDALQIPNNQRSWYSSVSESCAYLAASKGKGGDEFKKYFKAMLEKNYVRMDNEFGHSKKSSTRLNGALFIHSPQMRLFQGEDGRKRLQAILLETNKNIEGQMNRAGLGKDWGEMSWYSDDYNGIFRLVQNGRGIGSYNGSFIGGLYYSENLKEATTKSIGAVTALGFTIPMLATNDVARQKAMNNYRVYYTKSEAENLKGGFRDSLRTASSPNNSTSRTLNQIYGGQDSNFKKELITISSALTDSRKVEKMINNIAHAQKGPNMQSKGATQSQLYLPDNKIIRTMLDMQPNIMDHPVGTSTAQSYQAAPLATGKEVERGMAAGYAVNIDYDSIEAILSETDSATKIVQSDVSIPISMAAAGNEGYIDVYNVTQAAGFNITGAPYQSIVMDNTPITYEEDDDDIGMPTGFAADITKPTATGDMFSGDQNNRPNTTTRMYSKGEISQLVTHYAKVFGIPIQLANAVVNQESGGKQYVESKVGAKGIMQLMPGTAKSLGVADSSDAAQNVWGGMKYLAQQYKQFGCWEYALAAYNAGPGAVSKHKGIPPYNETVNYVRNIMKKAGMDWKASSYPVNFDISDEGNRRRYIDPDTNMLSKKGMNDFIYLINNSAAYKGKVEQIKTNRPELLENKPEYADYKEYRAMKTSDGKPLFVKGTVNGMQIMVKKDKQAMTGGLNSIAIDGIADDAYANQTQALGQADRDSIQALVTTFSSRYNNKPKFNSLGVFGLAQLTPQEYEDYGVPLAAQQNPMMQARVLTAEFQRAKDVLGSDRKAIYALSGGNLKSSDGTIKSWAEIKKDKDNFTKQWFIQPSSDAKERDAINALVATYNSEYNKARGII